MAKYANQKSIKTNKNPINLKSGLPFLQIHCEDLEAAARELNQCAFKLYLYLASNRDNYITQFSPKHFGEHYGVSINSARRAMEELEEKGFIKEVNHNFYNFTEEQAKDTIFKPEIREFTRNGRTIHYNYNQFKKDGEDNECSPEQIERLWNTGKVIGGNN